LYSRADNSDVPASVTFTSIDRSQTSTATVDGVDDDAENITLRFGALP